MSDEKIEISLQELLLHSRISEKALVDLLDQGALPVNIAKDGAVVVDISQLGIKQLANSLIKLEVEQKKQALFNEEIFSALEPILDEAVSLALQWIKEDSQEENSKSI